MEYKIRALGDIEFNGMLATAEKRLTQGDCNSRIDYLQSACRLKQNGAEYLMRLQSEYSRKTIHVEKHNREKGTSITKAYD